MSGNVVEFTNWRFHLSDEQVRQLRFINLSPEDRAETENKSRDIETHHKDKSVTTFELNKATVTESHASADITGDYTDQEHKNIVTTSIKKEFIIRKENVMDFFKFNEKEDLMFNITEIGHQFREHYGSPCKVIIDGSRHIVKDMKKSRKGYWYRVVGKN